MQITQNSVVGIYYVLTDSNGKVLDQSASGSPLLFIHGIGHLIPGLEEALEGKTKGEKFQVSIAPEKGYGVKDSELIQQVGIEAFGDQQVAVGMQFTANSGNNQYQVTVTGVSESHVTIDANHPLAGETLNFDVEIESVREATPDELAHGHVHGPGGHHH